jgi:hypothetical protein
MKAGKEYMATNIKFLEEFGRRTSFRIGDKQKDGTWLNFNCYADEHLPIQEKQKVMIETITSVRYRRYIDRDGKEQFAVDLGVILSGVGLKKDEMPMDI